MKTATAVATAAAIYTIAMSMGGPAFALSEGTISLRGDATLQLNGEPVRLASLAVSMSSDLTAGESYFIRAIGDVLTAVPALALPGPEDLGGFLYAPGSNAVAREGGDGTPQIDPNSLWDLTFRPVAPDPRGMVFVANSPGMPGLAGFWMDKFLLAQDHHMGTSRFGAVIADGRSLPDKLEGSGRFGKLDFETANAIAAHHGKRLPTWAEFVAAAYGAKERTAAETRDETSIHHPLLTSRFMSDAFGVRWVWGTDGDPDDPRASIFGGSWFDGGGAGSRCANLDYWPGDSGGVLGARLCCDHLQLV